MKNMKKFYFLLATLLFTLLIPVCKPSVIKAATINAPQTLTVKQGRNNVTIQWSKVSNAKGYVIYRKNSISQSWKRLKVVKAPTLKYADKKVSSGKSYFYTVRAYTTRSGKNTYGTYNKSGKNVVYLKEPKVTATKSHKSVTLKWNKTTGASGYEVYRKSDNSGYSKLDATTALSYTDKNVEPSTKYTYAVRAYKKSGKTTFRSLYYDDQNLVDVKTNKEPEVTPEPEVDINDAVESKVFIHENEYGGKIGLLEVYNKSLKIFYDVQYKVTLYDDNDKVIFVYPYQNLIYQLNSKKNGYAEFIIPSNYSSNYSYCKTELLEGKKLISRENFKKYLKIGDLYTVDNSAYLKVSNIGKSKIYGSIKVVLLDSDHVPIEVKTLLIILPENGLDNVYINIKPEILNKSYRIIYTF